VQELRRLFEAFFRRRLHASDLRRGGGYRICAVDQPVRPVQMLPKVLTNEIQQAVAPRNGTMASRVSLWSATRRAYPAGAIWLALSVVWSVAVAALRLSTVMARFLF
jgi:hypothetical protein